jgi:hypothetical protein
MPSSALEKYDIVLNLFCIFREITKTDKDLLVYFFATEFRK